MPQSYKDELSDGMREANRNNRSGLGYHFIDGGKSQYNSEKFNGISLKDEKKKKRKRKRKINKKSK